MEAWILILWFNINSTSGQMAQVRGYSTESECQQAGAAAETKAKAASWSRPYFICIPGPGASDKSKATPLMEGTNG